MLRWPAIVAAVLVLAACSGDDGGDNARRPATTALGTTAPAPVTSVATAAPTTAATTSAPVATTTTTALPVEQPVPEDPAPLGRHLAVVEQTVRDPGAPPTHVAAAGRAQQRAYQRLVRSPDWLDAVLAAVPDDLDPVVRANAGAGLALTRLGAETETPDTLPAWRIIDPLPPERLLAFYREAEAATGVPWAYLAAVNLVETRMGRIVGLSTAGARGPMQFLPSTFAECCEGDIDDPHDAIVAAGVYLRRNGAPGDMARALFRYNNSRRYVDAVTAYATTMLADERAYLGYHAWEVYVPTTAGTILLPTGYEEPVPVPAAAWLARTGRSPVAPPPSP